MNNNERILLLKRFYSKLEDRLLSKKSLHGSSCFISLIKMNSNPRDQILRDSAIDLISLNYDEVTLLEKNKDLLRIEGGYEGDSYVLTAKAIWELDKSFKNLSESDLIAYFEKKDFKVSNKSKGLNAKEKRIILSLLTIRCFDESTCMDLSPGSSLRKYWEIVYTEIHKLLIEYKLIDKNEKLNTYTGTTTVEYELLRANELAKKTHQIFSNEGSKNYFLKVLEDDIIVDKKLIYLFKLLFENSHSNASELLNLFDDIEILMQSNVSRLRDSNKFCDIETDEIIFECFKEAVIKYL